MGLLSSIGIRKSEFVARTQFLYSWIGKKGSLDDFQEIPIQEIPIQEIPNALKTNILSLNYIISKIELK